MIQAEFYGDNVRWFIADVIDTSPPYGFEGRVRIRIHGIHDPSTVNIKQRDLPWAQCVLPSTEGGASGIGMSPDIQPGALCFGFFMDGIYSQTPIVLGTLPRTEYPTPIQEQIEFENVIERQNPVLEFYQRDAIVSINTGEGSLIDNDNYGGINDAVRQGRDAAAVQFFLASGYTLTQALAITGCLSASSGMVTVQENEDSPENGIAMWSGARVSRLKSFSVTWQQFSTQLAFVQYELNTFRANANIKVLATDSLEDDEKSTARQFAKYYLDIKDQSKISTMIVEGQRLSDRFLG